MAGFLYALCTLTAILCAFLLLRAYGRSRYKLLLWGGICFAGVAVSNALLVVDKIVLGPEVSLFGFRLITAGVSLIVLLYGLVWDSD